MCTQKERDRASKREEIGLESVLSNFRLQNVILKKIGCKVKKNYRIFIEMFS
jgi:hypothetical protein